MNCRILTAINVSLHDCIVSDADDIFLLYNIEYCIYTVRMYKKKINGWKQAQCEMCMCQSGQVISQLKRKYSAMWVCNVWEWVLKCVSVWEGQLQVSHSLYLKVVCAASCEAKCVRPLSLKGYVGGLQSAFERNVTLSPSQPATMYLRSPHT